MARKHAYLLALGSNMRHPLFGRPRKVLDRALDVLAVEGLDVLAAAPVIESDPIGPSMRRYANGAAVVETELEPEELLQLLQSVEEGFGRRRMGQPWRSRVLDLDIVLWDGGIYAGDDLVIPHPLFRQRRFVLGPASAIAADWKDPISGLSLQQLNARLTRRHPLPR